MPGRVKRGRVRGFSLFEVVASLAILSTVFLAVASLQAVSLRGARDMHDNVVGAQIASSLMAQVQREQMARRYPANRAGRITSTNIPYEYHISYQPVNRVPAPNVLRDVIVTVRWVGEDGPDQVVRRSTIAYPLIANPPPEIGP